MATKREYHVGNVLGRANNRPIRFSVLYRELGPDSNDVWNRWPHLYVFTTGEQNHGLLDHYLVQIDSEAANQHLRNDSERARLAVRYGLRAIESNPAVQEGKVDEKEYERFQAAGRLEGLPLRTCILEFCYSWYELNPQESIGIPDLMLFFNASEDQLRQWTSALVEKEFLVKAHNKSYERELGFGYSIETYKINPKREEDVRQFLQTEGVKREKLIPKLFLSYSTVDRLVAGRIASELRKCFACEVFLAHEDIEVSEHWRARILKELKDCDAILALVTPNFRPSKWTDQEVGNVVGQGKKVVPIFSVEPLHGFLEMFQGIRLSESIESMTVHIGQQLGLVKR